MYVDNVQFVVKCDCLGNVISANKPIIIKSRMNQNGQINIYKWNQHFGCLVIKMCYIQIKFNTTQYDSCTWTTKVT